MKSRPIGPGQNILASQNNDKRDDARGGSFLLAHQQLGTIALPTNPSNTQTLTLDINGTNVVITFVTTIGSTANNVLIGASAAATAQNLVNFLRRPDLTNSTQVAASSGNQSLLQYCGYGWPGSSSNIVPFSLNKNVNGLTGPLTSFSASTTATGGSWTANTMALYVEDGTYFIGSTRILFTGGSTPTVTAPVSHPRIDVLAADSSGNLAWTTGTENASPVAPTYPTGKVVICELYNVVSETALYDNENQQSGEGYIYNDVRPILGGTYISAASQIASGVVIFDPGSEAQGDILYYNGSAWVLLAPGTSGQFLKTFGSSANPQWANASIRLFTDPSGSNTTGVLTTPATIESFTLPANTLGANGFLEFYMPITSVTMGSGATTLTLAVKIASTTIASIGISGASSSLGGYLHFRLFNANATNSQIGFINAFIGGSGVVSTSTSQVLFNQGTAAVDTTTSQTISVTIVSSSGVNAVSLNFPGMYALAGS